MMERKVNEFVVETEGHCFLCMGLIRSVGFVPDPDPAVKVVPEEPCSVSLQRLSRYLELDMRKVFNNEKEHTPPPHLVEKVLKSRLKASLCHECVQLSERFSGLHQQLIKIQIEVLSCLELVRRKLTLARDPSKTKSYWKLKLKSTGCNVNELMMGKRKIVDALQNEMLEKCSLKINSSPPRVKIQKLSQKKRKKLHSARQAQGALKVPISPGEVVMTSWEVHNSKPLVPQPLKSVADLEDDNYDNGGEQEDDQHDMNQVSVTLNDCEPETKQLLEKYEACQGSIAGICSKLFGSHFKQPTSTEIKERKKEFLQKGRSSILETDKKVEIEIIRDRSLVKAPDHNNSATDAEGLVMENLDSVRGPNTGNRFWNSDPLSRRGDKPKKQSSNYQLGGNNKVKIKSSNLGLISRKAKRKNAKSERIVDFKKLAEVVHKRVETENEKSRAVAVNKKVTAVKLGNKIVDFKKLAGEIQTRVETENEKSKEVREKVTPTVSPSSSRSKEDNPESKKTIVNPDTGKFKCGICPMEFKNSCNVTKHHQSEHQRVRYKCDLCGGKEFKHKESYTRHHQIAHLGRRFECKDCNQGFTLKTSLKQHQALGTCIIGSKKYKRLRLLEEQKESSKVAIKKVSDPTQSSSSINENQVGTGQEENLEAVARGEEEDIGGGESISFNKSNLNMSDADTERSTYFIGDSSSQRVTVKIERQPGPDRSSFMEASTDPDIDIDIGAVKVELRCYD